MQRTANPAPAGFFNAVQQARQVCGKQQSFNTVFTEIFRIASEGDGKLAV